MPDSETPQRIECRACDAMVLPATADTTGGYCMPCAKALDSNLAKTMEDRKVDQEVTIGEQAKGCGFLLLLMPVVMFLGFAWKVIVVAAVAALLHFVFGVSWSRALIVGLFVYLGLGLISSIQDLPVMDRWFNKRAVQKQEEEKNTAGE